MTKVLTRKTLTVATACVLQGLASQHALADQAALEEVVVTARKVSESIQDIPVAVTAVTGNQLVRSGIAEFEDIAQMTPGFSTSPAPANETALNLTVRGQVQDDVVITLDPSVAVYVDGLYIARAFGMNGDILDVNSVQMIKGPQGTLFGRNATGGALVLETNNPDFEGFSGSIGISDGDLDSSYEAIVNVPLGERLAFRVAHQSSERDDYIKNVTTGNNVGGTDRETTRVKVALNVNETTNALLNYETFEQDGARGSRNMVWADDGTGDRSAAEYANANQFSASSDKVANSIDAYTYAKTDTVSLTINTEVFGGDLKAVWGHREVESKVGFDLDGAASPVHGTYGAADLDQDSFEIQLSQELMEGKLQLVTGAMWFEESGLGLDYTSGYGDNRRAAELPNVAHPVLGVPIVCFAPAVSAGVISCADMVAQFPNGYGASAVYWGDASVESFGVYTQGIYSLSDTSNLTLGLRYSSDDKTLEQRAGFTSSLPTDSIRTIGDNIITGQPLLVAKQCLNDSTADVLCAKNLAFDDSALSWTLGYDTRLSEEVMAYAKVSTGYRSGGFNIRTSGADANGNQEKPFQSEETTEYEIGLKGDFADGRIRWNTALYKSVTEDKQVNVIVSNSSGQATTIVDNAGEVEVSGFETEFTTMLTDNLVLAASYAYTDFEYTSYTDPSGSEVYPRPLPRYIPKSELAVSLAHTTTTALGPLSTTAFYYWVDKKNTTTDSSYVSNSANGNEVSNTRDYYSRSLTNDYGTLNLSSTLTLLDDKLDITLWGRNLLDQRARIHTLALTVSSYDYASAAYNDPSSYGISVNYRF
jgi:iron complex outermembrane receptor protein